MLLDYYKSAIKSSKSGNWILHISHYDDTDVGFLIYEINSRNDFRFSIEYFEYNSDEWLFLPPNRKEVFQEMKGAPFISSLIIQGDVLDKVAEAIKQTPVNIKISDDITLSFVNSNVVNLLYRNKVFLKNLVTATLRSNTPIKNNNYLRMIASPKSTINVKIFESIMDKFRKV